MRYHFYIKNLAEQDKIKVQDYFTKKFQKIEKMIKNLDQDTAICDVSIEYHQKHNCFTAGVSLELPIGTFYGNEDSHDLCKPVDMILNKLLLQIKKQKDKFRFDTGNRTHRALEKTQTELPSFTSETVDLIP